MRRKLFVAVLGGFSLAAAVAFLHAPAQAAISDSCLSGTTQNQLVVTPNHTRNFYIDSGQGQSVDAAYVSYTVKNNGSSRSNLWMQLSGFTGGALGLANPQDSAMPVGTVAGGASGTSFFLLKATTSSTTAQSHLVTVYSGKPGLSGSVPLYTCTYTFSKVSETIKAAANKVNAMSRLAPLTTVLGDRFIVQVEGDTGTIGSGNATDKSVLWLSPAARSTWPTQALRLESTSITFKKNNTTAGTITNRLSITLDEIRALNSSGGIPTAKSFSYIAQYTFRIIGSTSAAVAPTPVAQIASGTQMKHTDMATVTSAGSTAFGTGVSIAPTVSLKATKSIGATATISGGYTTLAYTVSLQNTGSNAVTVDQVVDTPSTELTYVPGSAKFGGAAIPDPEVDSGGHLVFVGPFSVPAATTSTITYSLRATSCDSGSFSFSNSVLAYVGTAVVGSTATTYQQVTASGTCGSTSVGSGTTEVSLPIEVATGPVSALGTTTATLTGTIDSNGTSGVATGFQWGTSPTLAGATTVNLTSTTTSTSPVAYSTNLTSLSTGTIYYYRIVAGTQYGQILSFVTAENPGTPTVATTSVSNLVASGLTVTATLGASVDPNQITNGVKVRFQWATDASSGSCSTLGTVVTAPTSFLSDDGTNDVLLAGSYATDVSLNVPDVDVPVNTLAAPNNAFVANTSYCYRVVGYYNASSASWSTPLYGSWVPFLAKNRLTQYISFPIPTITNGAGTASAISYQGSSGTTATSLPIRYVSQTTSVCTVDAATGAITMVTAGVCTLTASQSGTNDYEAATDVSVSFWAVAGPPVVSTDTLISGTYGTAYSVSLQASGGSGTYPKFTLASGRLPAGLSLADDGTISGTPTESVTERSLGFTVTDSDTTTSVTKTLLLTIRKAELLVTAPSVAVDYGDVLGTLSPSYSGFVNGDTDSVVTTSATCTSDYTELTPVASSPVAVTCSGAVATNYTFAYAAGEVTISPAVVEVTAPSATRTYGDEVGTLSTPSYSGFHNLQSAAVLTASPTCTTDYTATTGVSASPVIVSCSGAAAANYTFHYVDGAITIAKANQTMSADDVVVTYGDPTFAPTIQVSSGLTPTLVSSDPSVVTVLPDGTLQIHGTGTVTITVSQPGDGNFQDAADITFEVRVDPAEIVVTAPTQGVVQGSAVPDLDPAYSGFVYGEAEDVLTSVATCSTSYTSEAAVEDEFPVTCDGAAAANYTVRYVDGHLYVVATLPRITTTHLASGTYGHAYSTSLAATGGSASYSLFTLVSGTLPDGLSLADDGTVSGTPTQVVTEVSLTFTVTDSDHATSEEVTLLLSIGKAHLTITAPSVSLSYGDDLGELAPDYDGFVNGDDVTMLSSPAECTSSYSSTTPVADSPVAVTCTGAASDNYTISYDPGAVRIARVEVEVRGAVVYRTQGDPLGELDPPTYSGFVTGQSADVLTAEPTCTTTYDETAAVGAEVPVTCAGAEAANYSFRYLDGAVTVLAASEPTPTPTPTPTVTPTPTPTAAPTATASASPTASSSTGTGTSGGGYSSGGSSATASPSPSPRPAVPAEQSPAAGPDGQLVEPQPIGYDQFSIDAGAGSQPGSSPFSIAAAASNSSAVRSLDSFRSEPLGGFAPGTSVWLRISGARTVAQFVTASGQMGDPSALIAALSDSLGRNAVPFAQVSAVEPIVDLAPGQAITGPVTTDARDLFIASGLGAPRTLAGTALDPTWHWIKVSASVSSYAPGTVIYLAATTEPIIFGSVLVGADGTAEFSGALPLELLEPGAHNLRLVGTRDLGGVSVGPDGSVRVSDATMAEIQKFDQGTNAIVAVGGAAVDGQHVAVRLIPLVNPIPWWTLWVYAAACVLILIPLYRRPRSRAAVTTTAAVIGGGVLLPLIAAWLSFTYFLMLPAVVVTVLAAVAALITWRTGRDRLIRQEAASA